MVKYMESDGGWSNIEPYLPTSGSKKAQFIYINMAIYVDKSAKPIIDEIFLNRVQNDPNEDTGICEVTAMARLAALGIDMKVSEMVDAVTGGGGGILEGIELIGGAATLMDIWLSYEICKGRWH